MQLVLKLQSQCRRIGRLSDSKEDYGFCGASFKLRQHDVARQYMYIRENHRMLEKKNTTASKEKGGCDGVWKMKKSDVDIEAASSGHGKTKSKAPRPGFLTGRQN